MQNKTYVKNARSVTRLYTIRVIRGFRSVSYEAPGVIGQGNMPPDIMAIQLKRVSEALEDVTQ